MNIHKDFCIFILTHGRPNSVKTLKAIRSYGYTGPVYFVVDNQDKTIDRYIENFGHNSVVVFDKNEIAKKFDRADNFNEFRTITYARNACYDIAEKLGHEYFMQFDDDYRNFFFRFDNRFNYKPKICRNLDNIFVCLLNYYKSVQNIDTIAIAQGGDFIGGGFSDLASRVCLKRKAMNSFICSINRRIWFIGTMNEDVNTYVTYGSRGRLFFTINMLSLNQLETQSNTGGITEMYKNYGTYVKSFYTILHHPSSVKMGLMGNKNKRIHHFINWKYTVPKILREDLKK